MNKNLIKSRFSRHLEDYSVNAVVQKQMAEKLAKLCSRKEYGSVLEIGCGTGFLTNYLNESIKFTKYVAIDIVEECGDYISKINNDIVFNPADIESFALDKYDLIISNAVLQWTENFKDILLKLRKALNPSGELIFTTFGKEHFREIYYISGMSLNYYSESELREGLTSNSDEIVINSEIYIKSFNTPRDVLKHLKLTGVNSLETKSWTKSDLKMFENAYQNLCNSRPTLTYNPIYVKYQNKTIG